MRYVFRGHTHEQRYAEVQVTRTVRQRALQSPNLPASSVVREEQAKVRSEEAITLKPEIHAQLRTTNRYQNVYRPTLRRSLEELDIVPLYTLTLNGQQFLRFDFGRGENDKIMIGYLGQTKRCVSFLEACNNSRWHFNTVPVIFFQLYRLHSTAFFEKTCFPRCIAYVKGKWRYHTA